MLKPTPALTIDQRQAIFAALVTAQDRHTGDVAGARQRVARQFKVAESEVRQIENEGLGAGWPLP